MEPLKIIKTVTENLNNIKSQKHGYRLEETEQKTTDNENFQEIYDFYRLLKVKLHIKLHSIKELIFSCLKKIEKN